MQTFYRSGIAVLLMAGITLGLSADDATEEEVYSALVPIVFYTSDTGFAGGGLYQRFYPSGINMSLAGFYTQQNQINVFYNSSFFRADNPWWIQYGGSGRYYPESFYGIGPETEIESEEIYTNVGINQDLSAYWRVREGLYLGPALRYRWTDIVDPEKDGLIDKGQALGSEGYQLLAGGLGMGSGRDPLPLGEDLTFYYEAALYYASTVEGDPASALLLESDIRLFWELVSLAPVLDDHWIALQQYSQVASDDLPFAELPAIGGASRLRGYAADRFRDTSALLLQGDYRFPIYKRFKGAVFAAFGNVGSQWNDYRESEIKFAAGGGLRFQMGPTPDTSFRLDVAFSDEDFGVYFTFGEAF